MSVGVEQHLQRSAPGYAQAWEDVWTDQEGRWAIIGIGRRVYNSFFARFLRRYLSPSSTMVELGSGTASLGKVLAPGIASYTGIDSSSVAIADARKRTPAARYPNVRFLERDIFDLLPPQRFDLVWSQGLLEHFGEPQAVIERHLAFCKPGGHVVISVPAVGSYLQRWYALTRRGKARALWPWTDQRFFTHEDFAELVGRLEPGSVDYGMTVRLKPKLCGIILLVLRKSA